MITITEARISVFVVALAATACANATGNESGEAAAEGDDGDGAPQGGTRKRPTPAPPSVDPSAPQARLVDASPRDGETAFYPVEYYDQGSGNGIGERRPLRFTFDVPMDEERATIRLVDPEMTLKGTFRDGGTTFEAFIMPDGDRPPLDPERDYELDLSGLRALSGDPVGTPRVAFRTAARDETVDHACLHALFGPYDSVLAASVGTTLASAPSMSSVHRQYTLTLPGAEGDVRVAFTGTGQRAYLLLLDRSASVTVTDGSGNAITTSAGPSVPACPGIRHRIEMRLSRGTTYRLRVRSADPVKAIWETL